MGLIDDLFSVLSSLKFEMDSEKGSFPREKISSCERFVEFFPNLRVQPEDMQVIVNADFPHYLAGKKDILKKEASMNYFKIKHQLRRILRMRILIPILMFRTKIGEDLVNS